MTLVSIGALTVAVLAFAVAPFGLVLLISVVVIPAAAAAALLF